MANPEIRKFSGLYLQANSFNVPDGAMEIAENVVIQNDDIVSKTKGYFEYWRPGGDTLVGIKALKTYQGKLIGAFGNGLGYFTDTFPYGGSFNSVGTLTANPGPAQTYTKAAYFEKANSNLYVTGLQGLFKLEAYNSKVRKAGVAPGVSISISDKYGATGILGPDSQTAYRAVFGRRDTNGNLLLGAPSDVAYIGVPKLKALCPYTISGGVVTVNNAPYLDPSRVGQRVIISSATPATGLIGDQLITSVNATDFTFNTGLANGTGTLSVSFLSSPTVEVDIPYEINDVTEEWFVQTYRTPSSLTVTGAPTPTFQLVSEKVLTQTDLDLRFFRFTDTVDALLLGAELYTNENSREGEAQRNDRAPQANVIAQYKGYMLGGDVQTVQRMTLDMIAQTGLDRLVFRVGGVDESYVSTYGIRSAPKPVTGSGTGTITVATGSQSPLAGDVFEIYDITGTLTPGVYTVASAAGSNFTFSAPGKTMTAGTIVFLRRGTDFIFDNIIIIGNTTAIQNMVVVAQSLIRSINRNSTRMYADYLSTFDDFPGKIGLQSHGVSDPIYVRYSTAPNSPCFIQPIPDSFSVGKQIYSENDSLKNAIFWSKVGEPEAWPPLNSQFAGMSESRLLCIIPLRDCAILLKEDGAFKLTGDTAVDFQIVPIDTTVQFPGEALRAGAGINNVAVGMTNQGLVQVTDSSLQVISRRIDDAIQPLVILDLARTFLSGNEADRLFYVNTNGINAGDPDVSYIYNAINQTWTTTTSVFTHMAPGIDDANVAITYDAGAAADVIHRQRKTETLIDYCGKYGIGNIAVAPSKLWANFTLTGGNVVAPEVGDAFLHGSVFSRIKTVTLTGGVYMVTFAQKTSIPANVTGITFYKAYRSTVKMAPFHAGQVGLEKHFSEVQIHLRQPAISDCTINFGGAYFSGSEKTEWNLSDVSSEGSTGWGYAPWGFFPWGLPQGVKLSSGTRASSIIRTYVPRIAARNTFIQMTIVHQVAGQPLLVQALCFRVRGYGSRTSR